MNGPEARELLSLYIGQGLPEADAMHMVNDSRQRPEQLLRRAANCASARGAEQPAGLGQLRGAVHGHRANRSDYSFFFLSGIKAVIVAAIVSLAAHFAVGAAKSLITVPVVVVVRVRDDGGGRR